MADEEHATRGMTMVGSRVTAICAMIQVHQAAGTISAWQVATIASRIDQAAAEAEGRSRSSTTKRPMRDASSYDELCTLGEGAFGTVVKAVHRRTGRTVPLKAICERPDSVAIWELRREACFMEACRGSPSLVAIHGVARKRGTWDYSLVMVLVDGPTLASVVHGHRRGRPFHEADVRRIMWQLLASVQAMHKHGIMHRDIKPGNIFIQDDGSVVKIGDFGLAVSTAEQITWHAGTLASMAPEMLLGKPDCDTATDLWSVGGVMAELLAGTVLLDVKEGAEDRREVLDKIFHLQGVPGKEAWKVFNSPWDDEVQRWSYAQHKNFKNRLRERFPKELLSGEGYQVLKGLLMCNPRKRLDAIAALQLPWFAQADDQPVAPN